MKAAALKAVEAFVSVGSNPTPVANLLEVVIGTRRKIGGVLSCPERLHLHAVQGGQGEALANGVHILMGKARKKGSMDMSKITIAGDAVVITSSMKLEDIKTIEKYRPKALVLMGGEDGKDPVFAIDTTEGTGSISEYGASFGRESHDDEKLATITMCLGTDASDVKDWVADKIGGAIISLNKLEEQLPAVLAEIAEEKARVMESITVAQ